MQCKTLPGGCEANGYGGADRGYFAESFRTVALFYDPADLARVAAGTMVTHAPQPYLVWDLTPFMAQPADTYEIETGGVAYDARLGHLFITERYGFASEWRPVVHVWRVAPFADRADLPLAARP